MTQRISTGLCRLFILSLVCTLAIAAVQAQDADFTMLEEIYTAETSDSSRLVALSADGTLATMGSADSIILWDVEASEEVRVLAEPTELGSMPRGFFNYIAFVPDGSQVVATVDNGILVWDVETGDIELESRISARRKPAVLTPDGTQVAIALNNEIVFIDIMTGEQVKTLETQPVLSAIAFTEDGTQVWTSSSRDYTIRQWDVETGEELLVIDTVETADHEFFEAAFSNNLSLAITRPKGPRHNAAHLWDLETGELLQTFAISTYSVITFNGDATQVLIGNSRSITIFDVISGEALREINLPPNAIGDLALSPDGMQVFISGFDENARLWGVTGE